MKLVAWISLGTVGLGLASLAAKPSSERRLAMFTTTLVGRTENQRHNAELAVQGLNGAVILPGATFSFNGQVGTYSRDAGYRRAPVSYNGTLIQSWGGGVCQASTTLYNAALLGGLKIVERNRHRFAPGYVPPGRDAAVAFSTIDLKLANPYNAPIRILSRIRDDRLEVEIVGQVDTNAAPEIVTEVRRVDSPGEYEIKTNGRKGVRNKGKAGFEVATYRVTKNEREFISLDHYPSMAKVTAN